MRKLGEDGKAEAILRELTSPSGAAPSAETNASAAVHYAAGLGYAGLGDREKARREFTAALAGAPDHLGAQQALARL